MDVGAEACERGAAAEHATRAAAVLPVRIGRVRRLAVACDTVVEKSRGADADMSLASGAAYADGDMGPLRRDVVPECMHAVEEPPKHFFEMVAPAGWEPSPRTARFNIDGGFGVTSRAAHGKMIVG